MNQNENVKNLCYHVTDMSEFQLPDTDHEQMAPLNFSISKPSKNLMNYDNSKACTQQPVTSSSLDRDHDVHIKTCEPSVAKYDENSALDYSKKKVNQQSTSTQLSSATALNSSSKVVFGVQEENTLERNASYEDNEFKLSANAVCTVGALGNTNSDVSYPSPPNKDESVNTEERNGEGVQEQKQTNDRNSGSGNKKDDCAGNVKDLENPNIRIKQERGEECIMPTPNTFCEEKKIPKVVVKQRNRILQTEKPVRSSSDPSPYRPGLRPKLQASAQESSVQKTSANSVSELPVSYDEIECCETRGLKVTFRRRSAETRSNSSAGKGTRMSNTRSSPTVEDGSCLKNSSSNKVKPSEKDETLQHYVKTEGSNESNSQTNDSTDHLNGVITAKDSNRSIASRQHENDNSSQTKLGNNCDSGFYGAKQHATTGDFGVSTVERIISSDSEACDQITRAAEPIQKVNSELGFGSIFADNESSLQSSNSRTSVNVQNMSKVDGCVRDTHCFRKDELPQANNCLPFANSDNIQIEHMSKSNKSESSENSEKLSADWVHSLIVVVDRSLEQKTSSETDVAPCSNAHEADNEECVVKMCRERRNESAEKQVNVCKDIIPNENIDSSVGTKRTRSSSMKMTVPLDIPDTSFQCLPIRRCKSAPGLSADVVFLSSKRNATTQELKLRVEENDETVLDKFTECRFARSKSSPPNCRSPKNDTSGYRCTAKSPVVLLDRLPSPVVELYSKLHKRSLNSFRYRYQSESLDFSENEEEKVRGRKKRRGKKAVKKSKAFVSSSDDTVDVPDQDEEENVFTSDSEEQPRKSSGKLKFTYKKVSSKRKKYRIKDNSPSNSSFSTEFSNDEDISEYFDKRSIEDEYSIRLRLKRRQYPSKRRKQFSRQSKRVINYKFANDYNDLVLNTLADTKSAVHRTRKWSTDLPSSTKPQDPRSSDHDVDSPQSRRRYTDTDVDWPVNSSYCVDKEESSLIDPRIIAMSAALVQACQGNVKGQEVAFRSRKGKQKIESRVKPGKGIFSFSSSSSKNKFLESRKHAQKRNHGQPISQQIRKDGSSIDVLNYDSFDSKNRDLERGGMANRHEDFCKSVFGELDQSYHPRRLSGNKQSKSSSRNLRDNKRESEYSEDKRFINPGSKRDAPRDRNVFESHVFKDSADLRKVFSLKGEDDFHTSSRSNRHDLSKMENDPVKKVHVLASIQFLQSHTKRSLPECKQCTWPTPDLAECCCKSNATPNISLAIASRVEDATTKLQSVLEADKSTVKLTRHRSVSIKSESNQGDVINDYRNTPEPDDPRDDGFDNPSTPKTDLKHHNDVRDLTEKIEGIRDINLKVLDYSNKSNERHTFKTSDKSTTKSFRKDKSLLEFIPSIDDEHENDDEQKNNDDQVDSSLNSPMPVLERFSPSPPLEPQDLSVSSKTQFSSFACGPPPLLRTHPIDITDSTLSRETPSFDAFDSSDDKTPVSSKERQGYDRDDERKPLLTSSLELGSLALSKPLSIQINSSPAKSEFGSPTSVMICCGSNSPRCAIHHHPMCARKPYFGKETHEHQTSSAIVPPSKSRSDISQDVSNEASTATEPDPTQSIAIIPKIVISTASSPSSSLNSTQGDEPVNTIPSTDSCFISPSLPRTISHSRNKLPACSPNTRKHGLSPSKESSIENKFRNTDHGENRTRVRKCQSQSTELSQISSRFEPRFVSPPSERRAQPPRSYSANRGFKCRYCDHGDSDDSDATLVYPQAGKSRKHNTASSFTLSPSLSELSAKSPRRCKGEISPMKTENSLDQRTTELSNLVSDLRENISKTKAMKRGRRTNSFSGDNQPKLSDQATYTLQPSRPSFDRFMSIEPSMDSDSPYARIARDMDTHNQNSSENSDMLRFVSGLKLKPKEFFSKTSSLSDLSQAETKLYGEGYFSQPGSPDMKDVAKDTDSSKTDCYYEPEIITPQDLKLRSENEIDVGSVETSMKDGGTKSNSKLGSCIKEGEAFTAKEMNVDTDIYSDDEERPLVVIENADTDEVIEGDEAYEKVSTGACSIPKHNTGVLSGLGKRKSRASMQKLSISMRSLFTKKTCGHFKRHKQAKPRSGGRKKCLQRKTEHDDDDSDNGACSKTFTKTQGRKSTSKKLQCLPFESHPRGKNRVGKNSDKKKRRKKPPPVKAKRQTAIECEDHVLDLSSTGAGKDGHTRKDGPEGTSGLASKKRKKQSDSQTSSGQKPGSPELDPITEHLNQSSAARILQELPRYNWLEQKILQRTYSTAPSTSTGTVNSTNSSSNSNRTSVASSGITNVSTAVTSNSTGSNSNSNSPKVRRQSPQSSINSRHRSSSLSQHQGLTSLPPLASATSTATGVLISSSSDSNLTTLSHHKANSSFYESKRVPSVTQSPRFANSIDRSRYNGAGLEFIPLGTKSRTTQKLTSQGSVDECPISQSKLDDSVPALKVSTPSETARSVWSNSPYINFKPVLVSTDSIELKANFLQQHSSPKTSENKISALHPSSSLDTSPSQQANTPYTVFRRQVLGKRGLESPYHDSVSGSPSVVTGMSGTLTNEESSTTSITTIHGPDQGKELLIKGEIIDTENLEGGAYISMPSPDEMAEEHGLTIDLSLGSPEVHQQSEEKMEIDDVINADSKSPNDVTDQENDVKREMESETSTSTEASSVFGAVSSQPIHNNASNSSSSVNTSCLQNAPTTTSTTTAATNLDGGSNLDLVESEDSSTIQSKTETHSEEADVASPSLVPKLTSDADLKTDQLSTESVSDNKLDTEKGEESGKTSPVAMATTTTETSAKATTTTIVVQEAAQTTASTTSSVSPSSVLMNNSNNTTTTTTIVITTTATSCEETASKVTGSLMTSEVQTATTPSTVCCEPTTSAFTASANAQALSNNVENLAPLDLCVKKTDVLLSAGCRTKGNPPVQMVLPQVQQRMTTMTSTMVTSVTSSQVLIDSKNAVISALDALYTADSISDVVKSELNDDRKVANKSFIVSDAHFKVEKCFPLHMDTLDLCIKDTIKSPPSDPTGHDERETRRDELTIGLALTSDAISSQEKYGSGSNTENMEGLSHSKSDGGLSDDKMEAPLALTVASRYPISKTMTDAELDKEFQQHLLEFKALEKLAEKKAQEQMQVNLMRKRKAEMLRAMEMKKARRNMDKANLLSIATSGAVDHTPTTNSVATSVVPVTLASSQSPGHTSCQSTSSDSLSSLIPRISHSVSGSQTATATTPSPALPPSSTLSSASSSTALQKTETPSGSPAVSTGGMILPVTQSSSSSSLSSSLPLTTTTSTTSSSSSSSTTTSTSLLSSSSSIAQVVVKSEKPDQSEFSNADNDMSTQVSSESTRAVCKTEVPEDEDAIKQSPINLNVSENSSKVEMDIDMDVDVKPTFSKSTDDQVTPKDIKDNQNKSSTQSSTRQIHLVPVTAHQKEPETLPLNSATPTSMELKYISGPYHRREVAIDEPPFPVREASKSESPQRAHCQRPFETAGNLIVPVSGRYSAQRRVRGAVPVPRLQQIQTTRSPPGSSASLKVLGRPPTLPNSKDVVEPAKLLPRAQRKSFDSSDLIHIQHDPRPQILDSGPKSADYRGSLQSEAYRHISGLPNNVIPTGRDASGDTNGSVASQHQRIPTGSIAQSPGSRERDSNFTAEEKRSAFRVPVRSDSNAVIDLTHTASSDSYKKDLTYAQVQSERPQYVHVPSHGVEDPVKGYQRVETQRAAPADNPTYHNFAEGPSTYPGYPGMPRNPMDRPGALPSEFDNDRSRPGGFLTTRHRIPTKDPATVAAMQRQGRLSKEGQLGVDHVRPTVSSITQYRQKYQVVTSGPAPTHSNIQVSPSTQGYKGPSETLSPRCGPTVGARAPNAWSEGTPPSEFSQPNHQWRGQSPQQIPSASGPRRDVYEGHEKGVLIAPDEYDKQRSGRPGEMHASAFQKQPQQPKTLVISNDPGTIPPHPGSLINSVHGMGHPSVVSKPLLHQISKASHPFHHPSPGTQGAFERYSVHQAQQQQQQKIGQPLRSHLPIDGSVMHARGYPGMETDMTVAQQINASATLSDAYAYQKIQQQQQQQQQQKQQQILQSQQQQVIHHQQQQQQQQYHLQAMQQGWSGASKAGGSHPAPSVPGRVPVSVAPGYGGPRLGPPQRVYGESRRSPNYIGLSPGGLQGPGMMNGPRAIHHSRISEAEQVVLMRQQTSMASQLYEQRAPAGMTSQTRVTNLQPSVSNRTYSHAPIPVGHSSVAAGHAPPPPPSSTNSPCVVCGKVAVFLCSNCRRVWYCNQQCQTKHWGHHAPECKPLP